MSEDKNRQAFESVAMTALHAIVKGLGGKVVFDVRKMNRVIYWDFSIQNGIATLEALDGPHKKLVVASPSMMNGLEQRGPTSQVPTKERAR